jgi:shikimate dehydrogenase
MAEPYAELIGDPVTHSLSPAIHRHWLKLAGLAGDYRAVRCALADLPDYLARRRADPDWRGCNVTMPLKAEAARLTDRADSLLAASGAANCIVPRDGALVAFNTDVTGIRAALADYDLKGRKAVIIGKGGAARAAAFFLGQQCAELTILARDAALGLISPDEAARALAGAAVVVNATPLGMAGGPVMPRYILEALATAAPGAVAFDMVYDPHETEFLLSARAARLRTIDGLTMLIGQARRAFELFFGVAPPPGGDEALRERLLRAD